MSLREVKRRAFDILASSILGGIELVEWLYNDKVVKLPFYIESKPNEIHLFKNEVEVPSSECTWFLKLVLTGNALLKIDGESYAGIDETHTYVLIPPGKHILELRVSPRSLFGIHDWRLLFDKAYLVEVEPFVFRVGFTILNLTRFIEALPPEDRLRSDLEELLVKTLSMTRLNPSLRQIALLHILLYEHIRETTRTDLPREHGEYKWLARTYGIGVLRGYLEDIPSISVREAIEEAKRAYNEVRESLERLREKYPKQGLLYIAGHSHIDAAWLWPASETIEKVLRTFSTIVRLSEEYDFTYVQSSAQYYEWVEERDSALFEKIKRLVNSGKWVLAGGMWVESDTNLIEGECLARQFLYGQRYFLERFGRMSRIGWIPDSFGFSGNLPQIMKKSGIEVFVTHKVMWNDTNEFPYHSFKWIGIDGTAIPVQVLITSYSESMTPESVYKYWARYKQKNEIPFIVYAYGYGNGGGGPTREMLELVNLINELPSLPIVRNVSEEEYINTIKKHEDRLPIWSGELYLEFHRGTYTTNVAVKSATVEAEASLTVAETMSAAFSAKTGIRVEKSVLDKLWRLLLFNHFHDILPGSSIKEVYDDALRDLEYIAENSQKIVEEVLGRVIRKTGSQREIIVLNAHPWTLSFVAKIPKSIGLPSSVECQEVNDGYYVLLRANPTGLTSYELVNTECKAGNGVRAGKVGNEFILENEYLKLTIGESGDIKSLLLKQHNLELLREPAKLLVHVDKPGVFDAWEITSEFLQRGTEMNVVRKPEMIIEGPLISCVKLSKGFEGSVVEQTICLYKETPVVEVRNRVGWSSKGVLLKHWFKTTIDTTRAYFDIPFGVIERTTEFRTSWEKARFETPALRWVDISDGEKGLAIIAPSRHGYSVVRGKIGLSLIRSPVFPNPWSDLGVFDIIYYLYPHEGDYHVAEVPKIARELVFKPLVKVVEGVAENFSAISINPPKAILTAFKYSYHGDGFVLRLYNPYGKPINVKVVIGFTAKKIVETDIVELESRSVLAENTREFEVYLSPFEVKTIKIDV